MHYNQFVPYTDRLDYLAPLANNVAYACAVEKLMGWELPPRGQALRVLCCELARISAHMLGVGVCAMDVGAMTVFLYTFTEREKVYNLCEQLTGARFTTSYTRVGGQLRDMPPGFDQAVRTFLEECEVAIGEISKLLDNNKIFRDRMMDVGVISRESAISYGMTGPIFVRPAATAICGNAARILAMKNTISTCPSPRKGIATPVIRFAWRRCASPFPSAARFSIPCRTAR